MYRLRINCSTVVKRFGMFMAQRETTIWSGALALTKDMLARGSVPIGQPIDNTQFLCVGWATAACSDWCRWRTLYWWIGREPWLLASGGFNRRAVCFCSFFYFL